METLPRSSISTSEQGSPPPFTEASYQSLSEQLVLPLTDSARAASRQYLDKLHPGNRFRLMFGMPLLPQELPNGISS
jgi:hypothetical protein